MATNDDKQDEDDGPWRNRVSLSADGKLEGLELEGPAASALWLPPAPSLPAPLELAEIANDAPPPEPEVQPASNAKPLLAIAATLLLCALVIAALIFHPWRSSLAQPAGGATAAAAQAPAPLLRDDSPAGSFALTVQSVPAGAAVFVAGEEKGRTPFLGNNDLASGAQVEVRLELAGYRPWIGKLTGGANASLDVRLKRR